ncbi:MAG: error-prone DNA polymerase, partial [Pseudomonadota bacterium]
MHIEVARPGRRGSSEDTEDGISVLCFPTDRAAYGRLSGLLTVGKRRAEKGSCVLSLADVEAAASGQILVLLPDAPEQEPAGESKYLGSYEVQDERLREVAVELRGWDCVDLYLGACCRFDGWDTRRLKRLAAIAALSDLRLVALNDVRMHEHGRRPLLDVMSAIRYGVTVDRLGFRAVPHGEFVPRPVGDMKRLFQDYPEALDATWEIVEQCSFSLDELQYEYPDEITRHGRSPQEELEVLTWAGARERYGGLIPKKVKETLKHELHLIGSLSYAPYFLTVYDIVRFARERGIFCQGRGSAANSAVCYCLGITAVDPSQVDLLFERFVSAERREPPDIDVDFEHERREEVIQYIYRRFGRDRAGLAATVSCFRARGALRDVGKAMGLSDDLISAMSGTVWGWGREGISEARVEELGLDLREPRLAMTLALADEIIGFPRHLSQHVGGFVITRNPLGEVVPIENAAMADRTVIEWDKDDLDALGMLKIDVLALGMLTCVRKGFDLIARHYGLRYDLATLPAEDAVVYDMLCKGDSLGVFQVESRAQMSMLPRLKPRCFYDLVVEVAIVRPGPIQGDMVHPYLRRRAGSESVEYPSEELRAVLEKTLGVPLFQEQAMKIAIVGAGFTPSEADRLRRAMATFRKVGIIHTFREKLIEGMASRGYDRAFAERCFNQIEGFGTYGFPESHAASFALLVYVSSWMKCHYPAAFACALLNSQPMGFYAPAQIVRDARAHGVEVLPVDVNASDWDCTLEAVTPKEAKVSGENATPQVGGSDAHFALRLGLRQIKGFSEVDAISLVGARGNGYRAIEDIARRAGLSPAVLEVLAEADAFNSLGLGRRAALWDVKGVRGDTLPLFAAMGESDRGAEPDVAWPLMAVGEEVVEDYARLRLTLRTHPI